MLKWLTSRETWDGVGQNVIANIIVGFLGILAAMVFAYVMAAWTFIHTPAAPWIVSSGVYALGAALWLWQRLSAPRPKQVAALADTEPQLQVIESLKAELAAAKAKIPQIDKQEERNRRAIRQRQVDLAEVLEEKEALKRQIESAPASFEVTSVMAWFEGTQQLLGSLRHTTTLRNQIARYNTEEQQRSNFHKAVAELRSKLVALAKEEAELRH